MKFSGLVLFILCIITLLFDNIFGDEEFDISTVQLQHTFDQGTQPQYSDRAPLTFRPLKASKFNFPAEVELTENDEKKLMKLVEQDGFYRLRIPIKSNDTVQYVTTYIKACSLYESGLSDILTLHTGVNGELLGISATTTQALCQGKEVPQRNLRYFNTVVEIRPIEIGPTPDTTSFIQKLEKEKADRDKNEQGDNRSFFAKYWMYIVPAVVFMFISQIFSPDPQGGGGGR
ncbi:hypothetical protein CHUAL_008108 [Chamberlinius hualienensis]